MFISIVMLFLSTILAKNGRHITTERAEDEYDFVIVGGGTSGSVIANRLSENPNYRTLVLEAGYSDRDIPRLKIIQNWEKVLGTKVDWNYNIVPQQRFDGMSSDHAEIWPRGKVLGGSSSINGMIYIRGSPHDFDSWEDHGATGWGWKNIRSYFRKLEGARDPGMSKELGTDGPLRLTKRYMPLMHWLVVETAKSLGYNATDYTEKIEGISSFISTIYEGIRESASRAYLYPILPEREDRLQILVNAYVTKIVLQRRSGKSPKAIGVNYETNGVTRFVKVRKEVIVCAGAVETPHLLMLSGIGPRKHLEEMGIEVALDFQGVGSNLQDHPMILSYFHATRMPKDMVLNPDMMERHEQEYDTKGTGPWLTPIGQATNLHIRTGLDGISSSTSERPFPDLQLMFFAAANQTAGFAPIQDPENEKCVSFFTAILLSHEKSSGEIRLKSKDPHQAPVIDPKYLHYNEDIEMLLAGLRHMERFETSALFKGIGAKMIMPAFCKELHEENAPRSDALYKCLIRATVMTHFHPCCTAKMGSKDEVTSVVNERLRVHGTEGLRIADASVMPHITSANTQSTCYVVGEKCADMIKEDWGYNN